MTGERRYYHIPHLQGVWGGERKSLPTNLKLTPVSSMKLASPLVVTETGGVGILTQSWQVSRHKFATSCDHFNIHLP